MNRFSPKFVLPLVAVVCATSHAQSTQYQYWSQNVPSCGGVTHDLFGSSQAALCDSVAASLVEYNRCGWQRSYPTATVTASVIGQSVILGDPPQTATSFCGVTVRATVTQPGGQPASYDKFYDGGNGKGTPMYSVPVVDRYRKADKSKTCGMGDPLYPLLGVQREPVDTGISVGGLSLQLTYDSTPGAPLTTADAPSPDPKPPVLGTYWSSSLHRRVFIEGPKKGALVARGNGHTTSFTGNGYGTYTPEADTNDRLLTVAGGFQYIDAAARSEETYDVQGKLTAIAWASGDSLTLTYSDSSTPVSVAPAAGYLIQGLDNRGRTVKFEYQLPTGADPATGGRLAKIVDASGQGTLIGYDGAGNLSALTWPDTTVRQFLYELPSFPWALTGITDERLARHATFGYDGAGRAISTELAGGADRFSTTYSSPPAVAITDVFDSSAYVFYRYHDWVAPQGTSVSDPHGASIGMVASSLRGKTYLASQSQPEGSGCAASGSSQTYDQNGNLASLDDFNQHRVCHAYDLGRNLETVRVEGLDNTASCATLTAAGAALPTGARKTSTQWHPDWRVATKVAEPKRITTSVYNGQPDPFNGNAVASCAPSNATLPDGKRILALCKQVEQATTDADGSAGLTASLDTSVPARVVQWTYNQYGQVLTAKDPLNHTTTNSYYSNTTVDHTLGDLATVTNALTQVVANFTKYNPAGQWLEMVDANGVTTTRTFDLRQRLKSSTTVGATTSYDYWPNGLLKTVTLPDASFISYGYDDAHRLTSITDNLGNSITYTLDNAGNQTAQTVKDPTGALSRTLTQSFDALGRVQQTTGRP